MSVFSHVMVGSNDLEKSRQFYDKVLGALGINYLGDANDGTRLMYGKKMPEFFCTKPRDGKAATHANGGTIGFAAPSKEAVDAFHAAALDNGGSDAGGLGPSGAAPNVYGAWIRDPDGNKLCTIYVKR